jgi:uncharacterized membrane protein YfcA
MMVWIVLGTVPGSFLLSANSRLTVAGLGFVLVAYALYSLFGKQLTVPPAMERWLSSLVGLVTGVVTGATGVFVMPAVPFHLTITKEFKRQGLLGCHFAVLRYAALHVFRRICSGRSSALQRKRASTA